MPALGHTEAQDALGGMYLQGRGVEQDYVQAASWFQRAADSGHARAKGHLAVLLSQGLGIQKDLTEAQRLRAESEKFADPPKKTWLEHVDAVVQKGSPKKSIHNGDF